jgi:hypothetical protein
MNKKIKGYEMVERPPDPWRCGNCVYMENIPGVYGDGDSAHCKRHDRKVVNHWGICPEHTPPHCLRKIKDIQYDIKEAKDMIRHFSDLNCSLGPRHPHGEDEKGEIAGQLFREEMGWWNVLRTLENELEVTRHYRKWSW